MYPPPYTYNDPRLTYNEHCFYYNGGYDEVCLIIGFDRKRRVGVGGGGRRKSEEREEVLPWIDITIQSQLTAINGEFVEDANITTQGAKGELSPGNISLLASRAVSEAANIEILAKEVVVGRPTTSQDEQSNDNGADVIAEPILATRGDRFIPLANLRSSTASIIFKTEITSSLPKKSEQGNLEKVDTVTKTEQIECSNDINFKADLVPSKKNSGSDNQ